MLKLIFNKHKNYLIIFDQGFVSIFNFFFVIFLIKEIGLESFGIYSMLWIIVLLSLSIQQALIISPLYSLGPFYIDKKLKNFYGSLIFQNLLLILTISILAFLILKLCISFGIEYFQNVNLFLLCTTIFFVSFQNFLKRLFFSQKKNINGALCNLLSYIFLILLLIDSHLKNTLDINYILQSYSISFFLGGLFGLKNLKETNFDININLFFFKENWKISKWIFFSNTLYWFSGYFWTIILGLIVSPSLVAVVRACTTLAYSVNVLYQALENIIPSNISEHLKLKGLKKTHFHIKKLCRDYFIISLMFSILVGTFSDKIVFTIYGETLLNYTYVLIFFCLLNIINCFQYPITAGLRSLKNTKPLFNSYLVASLFTLIFAYPFISMFHLKGFIIGLFLNQLILIISLIFGYYKIIKKNLNQKI